MTQGVPLSSETVASLLKKKRWGTLWLVLRREPSLLTEDVALSILDSLWAPHWLKVYVALNVPRGTSG